MRFLLIDQIVSMEPGRRIHALKTMSPDEELFLDHFPGFPTVPGVLLVEMMAQATGKCLHAEGSDRGLAMLGSVKTATFREWVAPGDLIEIFSEVQSSRPQFATAKCHVAVGTKVKASAELLFSFMPRDRFAADYQDRVLEEFLLRESQA
jgi:3-hydroxyacyl-[acyl-carrier-protein] dehydratase